MAQAPEDAVTAADAGAPGDGLKADHPQGVVPGGDSGAAWRVGDMGPRQKPDPAEGRPARDNGFLNVFLPNRVVSGGVMALVVAVQVVLALVLWTVAQVKVLPRPMEVLEALQRLWLTQGLGPALIKSFGLSLEALAWSTLLSLLLSYLTVLPLFRPLVAALSKGRFLSMVGFSVVFYVLGAGGREVKLGLLIIGMTVYYLTSMASVIAQIPKEDFDHARTLQMGEWRVVWEVVVLGTLDKAFEVMRQNAAIGWMMLTAVEGIVRMEGGVGVLLIDHNKLFHLPEVFAIQGVILVVALMQDYGIGLLRKLCCPYADLKLERGR